jgi:hypothetical protein
MRSRHFFLVRRQDYEGGAWFLVDDQSGNRIELESAPVGFSQDGLRFLVLNDDVADEHKNNIEIWRREKNGAVLEWANSVEQQKNQVPAPGLAAYTSEMMHWQGNHNTLSLRQDGWFDAKVRRKIPDRYGTESLTRTDTGWRLQTDWPGAQK